MGPWLFFLILTLNGVFCGGSGIRKEIRPGVTYNVESPDYPAPIAPNYRQSWDIISPPKTRIKLSCFDIRLRQYDPVGCEKEALIIDDGKQIHRICGTKYDLDIVTASNRLRMELKIGIAQSGGVQCMLVVDEATIKPEHSTIVTTSPNDDDQTEVHVELHAGGPPSYITSSQYPANVPPNTRLSWSVRTDPSSRIRITCEDIRLVQGHDGACVEDTIKIIDGTAVEELCGSRHDYTKLSSGNTLSVVIQTGQYGGGGVKCEVRGKVMDWYGEATTPPTTTTPEPPPYLGISSEEVDSSEYGGPPGPKSTTCKCGWTNKANKRIVGGKDAGIHEYPYMAALVTRGERYSFCGASIITRYHVLTAAHCTYNREADELSIVVGEHDQSRSDETDATKVIDVKIIVQHEEYNQETKKHDITLLVLERGIEFSQLIGPVCLSRQQLNLTRQYVKQIGWGRIAFSGPPSTVLLKTDTRVIHIESCHKRYSIVSAKNPTQICVYATNRSACMGDSGGPVLWLDPDTNRYTQVGLVSFGRICALTDPAVKTDVSAYMGWIEKHVKESHPNEEMCFKS